MTSVPPHLPLLRYFCLYPPGVSLGNFPPPVSSSKADFWRQPRTIPRLQGPHGFPPPPLFHVPPPQAISNRWPTPRLCRLLRRISSPFPGSSPALKPRGRTMVSTLPPPVTPSKVFSPSTATTHFPLPHKETGVVTQRPSPFSTHRDFFCTTTPPQWIRQRRHFFK